jgi:5-methylcytosine-specific restriction endonuclease McrBC regulatory subunit McrC
VSVTIFISIALSHKVVLSQCLRSYHKAMKEESSVKSLRSSLDLDEEFLEVLLPYLDKLIAMGINLNYPPLQDAIEGHVNHLEAACRALIGYAGWLAYSGDHFSNDIHASRCFIKALVEQWKPHATWAKHSDLVAQARYVSPYERARILIHELSCKDGMHSWKPDALEALSDKEIKELLPDLERVLDSLP